MEDVAGRAVLLLRRFDRLNQRRIPFLSAMSLLEAEDNEQRSYLEIADALRRYGAKPEEDCDSSTAATPPDDVLGSDSIRFWSPNDVKLNYVYNLIHRNKLSEQQIKREALKAVVASLKRGVMSP